MNKFLKEFKDRGYFYQCTSENELSNLLDSKSINAYIGFDSTAPSLHVGSLLQIMCLRLLQKHGHRPIVLLGGGTTRIGDPSGKEETRKILSEKEIENNRLELIDSGDPIGMNEEATAVRKKKNSSINVAMDLVKNNKHKLFTQLVILEQ